VNSSPRLAVASEHPIVVAGIHDLLDRGSGSTTWRFTQDPYQADVVIYDTFNLALGSAELDELRRLTTARPGRVLALSRLLRPTLTGQALAAGAVAPISMGAESDELVAAVEAVLDGTIRATAADACRHVDQLAAQLRPTAGLTPREESVLVLIAAGYSNKEIAAELYLSVNTIKSVNRSTYRRLGLRTRPQAVSWAVEHGYTRARTVSD
jgi:DNA-binding NarL/FixJ family response regulator